VKPIYGNSVLVKDGKVEQALRKFKKKVAESGLLVELRDRETYEKPTTKRKRKKSAAKNRWQKQLASQTLPKKLF
jgi:small subunit ribosomal protein S21